MQGAVFNFSMNHLGSGDKPDVSGNVQAQMTHERGLWLNFATVFLKTLPPKELGLGLWPPYPVWVVQYPQKKLKYRETCKLP